MNFIKKHWFSCTISGMIFCFLAVFVLILLAPKQDKQGRGFIPCTQKMVQELLECDYKLLCSSKTVLANNWCMLKIIGSGISEWAQGKQSRPWSNYIFTPELPLNDYIDEEARQAYLAENPDTLSEMYRLNLLRKELENEEAGSFSNKDLWNKE